MKGGYKQKELAYERKRFRRDAIREPWLLDYLNLKSVTAHRITRMYGNDTTFWPATWLIWGCFLFPVGLDQALYRYRSNDYRCTDPKCYSYDEEPARESKVWSFFRFSFKIKIDTLLHNFLNNICVKNHKIRDRKVARRRQDRK